MKYILKKLERMEFGKEISLADGSIILRSMVDCWIVESEGFHTKSVIGMCIDYLEPVYSTEVPLRKSDPKL
jgi:hypothetical protein